MLAVVPDEWVEERRRLGLDGKDEMWDGVLHMVPPASAARGRLGFDLAGVLGGEAERRGLQGFTEPGVFDPLVAGMTSYRVPDLGFARAEDVTDRGIEGRAVLVVEVLSPKDQSYEKLDFYLRVGVEELLYVDPATRMFEVRRWDADGWHLVGAGEDGWTLLDSLGLALREVGVRLEVRTDVGIREIS